jgi:hypothetical protein
VIGRVEACEGGFQVRKASPAQNAPHYQPLFKPLPDESPPRNIVSIRYVSQLEAAFAGYGAPKAITIIPCCGRDEGLAESGRGYSSSS